MPLVLLSKLVGASGNCEATETRTKLSTTASMKSVTVCQDLVEMVVGKWGAMME
jgi:hypothetical protein